MKILIICPYFGMLPNYFPFFLRSCETNRSINWLLFLDDRSYFNALPPNVAAIYTTLDSMRNRFQEALNMEVALETPRKIADFKPAYGYIFANEIAGYEYWGYCDLDMIMGDIKKFLPDALITQYDKLLTYGHLSLCRNTPEVNRRFMSDITGRLERYGMPFDYQDIFAIPENCYFDENSLMIDIHKIYDQLGKSYYSSPEIVANTDKFKPDFQLFKHPSQVGNQIFVWNEQGISNRYIEDEQVKSQKFIYVHFEKRHIDVDISGPVRASSFLITPKTFLTDYQTLTTEQVRAYSLGQEMFVSEESLQSDTELAKMTKRCWEEYKQSRKNGKRKEMI